MESDLIIEMIVVLEVRRATRDLLLEKHGQECLRVIELNAQIRVLEQLLEGRY